MAQLYDIAPLSVLPQTEIDWFVKALTGGYVLRHNKIGFMPGVVDERLLNLLVSDGAMLQPEDGYCSWNPTKYAKLAEKKASVKNYVIQKDYCVQELESKRTSLMMQPGANNSEIPVKLEEATLFMAQKDLSNEVEKLIFLSDTSNGGTFDGALKVAKDSTETIQLKGVKLTMSNIIDELNRVVSNIPGDVMAEGLENNTLVMYVGAETILQLRLASASILNGSVTISQNLEMGDVVKYLGIELVPVKGFNGSTIIAADTRNVYFVTDLVSDTEYFRVGRYPAPNDKKIFVDGRVRLGFVMIFGDEVVVYSADFTADRLSTQSIEGSKAELVNDVDLNDFDINLSVSKIKPFIDNSEDIETLNEWLEQEQSKDQPRESVVTLIKARINKLSNAD